MAVYTYSNTDENRFWLKLMIVKARIIYNSLPPDKPEVSRAKEFNSRFGALAVRADQNPSKSQLAQLNQDASQTTKEFRELLIGILRKQLVEGFYLNLKPSFLNSVLSLVDEYIYLLGIYLDNKQPEFDPVVQDIFWFPIFYEDAKLVADNVGYFDESIRRNAEDFRNAFSSYFQYAVILRGFFRTGITDFPIAIQYRKNIRELLGKFAIFAVDLINLMKENMLPGTLTLLEVDCMYRVLCYYTTQLSILGNVPKPACDPGGPVIYTV